MALYQYRCSSCENVYEKRLSMDDRKNPESEPCPTCGEMTVLQYLGGAPIIHSGEGITKSGKVDGGFKEVLQRIKSGNRGSNF